MSLCIYVYVFQCLFLSVSLCVSQCLPVCLADGGDGDNVAVGTTEEEIPLDPEFSEYVDVEGRSTDYTAAASDADLLTDGLRGSELPGAPATVHRSLMLFTSVIQCFYLLIVFFYIILSYINFTLRDIRVIYSNMMYKAAKPLYMVYKTAKTATIWKEINGEKK